MKEAIAKLEADIKRVASRAPAEVRERVKQAPEPLSIKVIRNTARQYGCTHDLLYYKSLYV